MVQKKDITGTQHGNKWKIIRKKGTSPGTKQGRHRETPAKKIGKSSEINPELIGKYQGNRRKMMKTRKSQGNKREITGKFRGITRK